MFSDSAVSAQPDAPRHILLVDDDPDLVSLLEGLLQAEGYRVTTACDGTKALEALAGNHFDAVLMDVTMPALDGIATARLVRLSAPHIFIFMHTATAEQEVRQRFDSYDGFFQKPMDIGLLITTLERTVN